jgi:prevent-host-death family protein
MIIMSLHEAKTKLSELVRDALDGETVVIARHGKPAVRLVPVKEAEDVRELGFYSGAVRIADDFDAPLNDFQDYQ